MTENLTKQKTLDICAELWDWLAEDSSRKKEAWPGWEEYGKFDCNCPCCEYDEQNFKPQRGNDQCEDDCILIIAWPYGCMEENSPFWRWDCYGHEPHLAKQIADFARLASKQLEKEAKNTYENNQGMARNSGLPGMQGRS